MNTGTCEILFSGVVGINYGYFTIEASTQAAKADEFVDPDRAFEGQKNGLCGAAQAGKLFFNVGVQRGYVSVRVELCEDAPEADEGFNDTVEVFFHQGPVPVSLCQWAHEEIYPLQIPAGSYRLRYSIDDMDREEDFDECSEDRPEQACVIQLWAGDDPDDQIVRSVSESGASRHFDISSRDEAKRLKRTFRERWRQKKSVRRPIRPVRGLR